MPVLVKEAQIRLVYCTNLAFFFTALLYQYRVYNHHQHNVILHIPCNQNMEFGRGRVTINCDISTAT